MLNYKIRLHYYLKKAVPRRLQIAVRRCLVRHQWAKNGSAWPTYEPAHKPPAGWAGWPEGKKFALVLTHDVESAIGYERCLRLADLDERHGFRSSFNFVANDYAVSPSVREELARRGFETGVHGWTHDSSLYHSREEFLRQAVGINRVLKEWNAVGFRSPCMYHHLDWLHDLDIEYDASTFDIDPFEPQPDGMHTCFPFHVEGGNNQNGYVELPYTLPQDFTLFVLIGNRTNDIWKRKLEWIVRNGGMALLVTHPDYMHLDGRQPSYTEYPFELYSDFLEHVSSVYAGMYWHALPREVARFWSRFALNDSNRQVSNVESESIQAAVPKW